jgi:hypothetical protein
MILLLGDRSRVWWRDLEGVFAGEDVYVTTLTEWATISRGAFAPEQIIERWHSDYGPADIEFMLVRQRYRVAHPNLRDDFLNIAILSDINRIIGDSGYHFAVCDNLGMPNWVVALTHEEEDCLRHDRGWLPARRPTPPDETNPQDQEPHRQQKPGHESQVDHRVWLCGLRGENRQEEA